MTGHDIQQKFIRHYIDPQDVSPFSPQPAHGQIILFSSRSKLVVRTTPREISTITPRSPTDIQKKLSSSFRELIENERFLLVDLFYNSPKTAALFPFKRGLILILSQLFRSNGLGIAVILNNSPNNASTIYHTDLFSAFPNLLFAERFESLPKKHVGTEYLRQELEYYLSRLDSIKHEEISDNSSVFKTIKIASELTGCPLVVEIAVGNSNSRKFDHSTLLSFLICILSHARRKSDGSGVVLRLPSDGIVPISVRYKLSSDYDEKSLSEIFFCEEMADRIGMPFCFAIDNQECNILFSPVRDDPSLFGFKSGIFINGKQFKTPVI